MVTVPTTLSAVLFSSHQHKPTESIPKATKIIYMYIFKKT